MKKKIIYLAAILGCAGILLASLNYKQNQAGPKSSHREVNSVYYWKTVFELDSAEVEFLRDNRVGRLYLRLFDVTVNDGATPGEETVVPNATVINKTYVPYGDPYARDLLERMEFVPTVYITLDALKAMKGREGELAEKIVTRAKNMRSYHRLPNVEELQLDCDWTSSTEESFFKLCELVNEELGKHKDPWALSSTIRLHQLARPAPPVDRGVLMVYNTGSFDNPDAANSIIDAKDVEPYLKRLDKYPLHLDVAYPTYSWQLLFRGRKFIGLMSGVDTSDTTRFSPGKDNTSIVRKEFLYGNRLLQEGDAIRSERSDFAEVAKVKALIDDRLGRKPHSNILYHLDSKNLSEYSNDEIKTLFDQNNR